MSAPPTTETLLEWGFSPSPDPAQAGRKLALRFVADVPVGRDQAFCDRVTIEFRIEPGEPEDPSYLTGEGTGIDVIVDPASQWHLDGASTDGTFTFVRPTGVLPEVTAGYTFIIHGIAVSPLDGIAEVTVREHSAEQATDPFEDRSQVFKVKKLPPQFGEVRFTTDTTHVEPGGVAQLTWEGDPDADYTLLCPGRPSVDLTKSTPPVPSPRLTRDTEFTLLVSRPQYGKTVELRYYLIVFVDTPIVRLTGDKDTILRGDKVTLTWDTENVVDCRLLGPGAPGQLKKPPPLTVKPNETAEYRLSCRTRSGVLEQDTFDVTVSQPAPKATADLVFVKTQNIRQNTLGKVELHLLEGSTGFQQLSTWITDFDASLGSSGTWTIAHYAYDRPGPDLLLIKTRDTASQQVEVRFRSYQSHYQQGEWAMSGYPARFGPRGTWLAVKMDPERRFPSADLVLVETAAQTFDEAVSRVAVHARSFNDGFESLLPGAPWQSAFQRIDAAKGTWLMADMARDGGQHPPDLVFAQTAETASGNVELSYATGASGYRSRFGPFVTGFPVDDTAQGTWQVADMDGDGRPDLVFVKTANTDSDRIEIYWAPAAGDSKEPVGGFTLLSAVEGPNGTWQVLPFFRG